MGLTLSDLLVRPASEPKVLERAQPLVKGLIFVAFLRWQMKVHTSDIWDCGASIRLGPPSGGREPIPASLRVPGLCRGVSVGDLAALPRPS